MVKCNAYRCTVGVEGHSYEQSGQIKLPLWRVIYLHVLLLLAYLDCVVPASPISPGRKSPSQPLFDLPFSPPLTPLLLSPTSGAAQWHLHIPAPAQNAIKR